VRVFYIGVFVNFFTMARVIAMMVEIPWAGDEVL